MLVDSPRGVEADLRTGSVTGHGRDRVISIETVYGSVLDDVLYGDDEANLSREGRETTKSTVWAATIGLEAVREEPTSSMAERVSTPPTISCRGTRSTPISPRDRRSPPASTRMVGINNLVGSKYDDTLIGNDDDNLRRDGATTTTSERRGSQTFSQTSSCDVYRVAIRHDSSCSSDCLVHPIAPLIQVDPSRRSVSGVPACGDVISQRRQRPFAKHARGSPYPRL